MYIEQTTIYNDDSQRRRRPVCVIYEYRPTTLCVLRCALQLQRAAVGAVGASGGGGGGVVSVEFLLPLLPLLHAAICDMYAECRPMCQFRQKGKKG